MDCSSRAQLLLIFVPLIVALLQLCAQAQNDGFVHFETFEFRVGRNGPINSQFFTFPFAANKSAPLNVSLNTQNSSGVVVSAQLCDNSRQQNSSNSSFRPEGILALTAGSNEFKSAILCPATLPLADRCPSSNHSADSFVLLLKVHSLLNGSHGTLAVRRTDTAEATLAFSGEGVPYELAEENGEWLLMKGQQPLILPIRESPSTDSSNLVQYSVHMAVRRGSAEVALLQDCPFPLNGTAFKNRPVVLDNFSVGKYLRFLDIYFGENDTINGTVLHVNHVQQQMEFKQCSRDGVNAFSSAGSLRLIISSLSPQPTIVAISQLRIFNAAQRSVTEGPLSSMSIGRKIGFIFLILVMVGSLFAFGFFAVLLAQRRLLEWRRVHYENERQGALQQKEGAHFELDQMPGLECVSRPPSTVSKAETSPEVKINAQALEERAVGSSGGWM
ncbi:hypothetical protein GPALN_001972 [Globodera pallida]|nr:hypothetical protein GPALN_001972 [Globodera pallida]